MDVWMLYLVYAIGVALSIAVPYLVAYLDRGDAFVWRKVVGQVIVAFVTILPVLGSEEFAVTLTVMYQTINPLTLVFAVLSMGWGVSNIGRTGQKAYDTIKG